MLDMSTFYQNATRLRGRNLAHSPRSPSQRAAVAARLVLGEHQLVDPTILQAAAICRVSPPYIRAALAATAAERAELAGGAVRVVDLLHPSWDCALERAWHAATPQERAAFGVRVGIDELFDGAVVPSL